MKKNGIVIYTQRVEVVEAYKERRDCADQRIAGFLAECGVTPIPVPNDCEVLSMILNMIHPQGVVLTGGNSAVKYGGNAPERDDVDRFLIEYAEKNEIPLYGFCRGMQSILDYYGNEIVGVEGHTAVRHHIMGNKIDMEVNSYHTLGCRELNDRGLVCVARSDDGVIEMVRHRKLPIVGTMWHPERETEFIDTDINMVKNLFGGI